ncbi:MAG: hypothetical protein WKF84_03760 [Pyrinomonadaceae bacterium]
MNLEAFKNSLRDESPPSGLKLTLEAMWYDAKGDWEKAHEIVQSQNDGDGAWVHAYLHRKEGDTSNANYWYLRSRRPFSEATIDDEWESLVASLLSHQAD